ncbi:sperm acrosome-associated protein 9 [Chanos chanos]|uniref:Sperm acrosome-associated protein 9 n=1 Tax=Chanos chanos TaxID=29144 RepID=A0A6J2WTN5_CHACN|nr:sperm acrosome-associated protein 9 [Chanos chanos]
MSEVRAKLLEIEHKQRRFRQQQFIFITALERSREHARERTEPVSTVAQVHKYMSHHCSNATDRRIFSLFLEIVTDLRNTLKLLESSGSNQSSPNEDLEACRRLLSPGYDIRRLRAHYPHDEVNRLSCVEARHYYGGVVSLIPTALDSLKLAGASSYSRGSANRALTPAAVATETPPPQLVTRGKGSMSADQAKQPAHKVNQSRNILSTRIGVWRATKPAWRPPGRTRI